jgi:hypothetical protein
LLALLRSNMLEESVFCRALFDIKLFLIIFDRMDLGSNFWICAARGGIYLGRLNRII